MSHRTGAFDRPTLPPIRDLFRDELSRSPRSYYPADSPFSPNLYGSPESRSMLLHTPLVGPGSQSSSSRPFLAQTPPPVFPHSRGAMSDLSYLPHLSGHFKSRSFPDVLDRREAPFIASDYAGPYRCNSYDSRESHHYPPDTVHLRRSPRDDQRAPTGYTSETVGHAIPTRGDYLDPNIPSTSKYDCHYCGKGFARPSSLKIHLNSHTGEKPFVCPIESCGRSFSVLSNMRRHARVHAQRSLKEQDSSDEGSDNTVPTSKPRHGRQHSTASSGSFHRTSLDDDSSRPEKRSRQHSK